MKKMWWWILGGLVVLGGIMFIALMSGQKSIKEMSIADVDLSTVSDGVHQGTFKQGRWNYTVSVTVKDHRITGIELLSKDPGAEKTFVTERERIISAQSLHVDVVSGATVYSKALLKAIENALTK